MAKLTRAGTWFFGKAAKRIRRDRDRVSSNQIHNFLVLQCEAPLGSIVHATPLYAAIKRVLPRAHISVAASPAAAAVLTLNPSIDELEVIPDPIRKFSPALRAVRELVSTMPSGPRAILTTVGDQRTRIACLSLLVDRAFRAGYTLAPETYDIALRFDPLRGQIESNLDILRRLGHEVPFCEPRVFFSPEDADATGSMLNGHDDVAPRIAFVTQNSGGQRNQWSQDRFSHSIGQLFHVSGAIPVFVGTSADVPAIESLRRTLPNWGISVAGKTTVPQLAAVLAQCDLVVSLDTGAFHVARAVELPGVVIAPAWQDAREWLPIGNPRYAILQGAAVPTTGPDYCMAEISVEQVTKAALDLLEKCPPAQESRSARLKRSIRRTT